MREKGRYRTRPYPPAATPLAIIGIGCLFPQAEDSTAYWANIAKASTPSPTSRPPTGALQDYYDPDPKAPDMTYGRRGGFLSPIPFNPLEFDIPPHTLEATDTSQLLGLVAAGQALKDAGYGAGARATTATGSASSSASPAPWNWSSRSARGSATPSGGRPSRRPGWTTTPPRTWCSASPTPTSPGRRTPSPACSATWSPAGSANSFDLGGTNCVVDAACASSLSALHLAAHGTGHRQVRHGRHRRHRHLQRHLHVHVLQQDPGAVAHRRRQAVRRRAATAPSSARGSASWSSSAWPTPSATATGSMP